MDQIKRLCVLFTDGSQHRLFTRLIIAAAEIVHRKINEQSRRNDLHRFSIYLAESRAQYFVPLDDVRYGSLKSSPNQLSPQPERCGHVVFRSVFLKLINKPQPLLGIRQEKTLGPRLRRQRERFARNLSIAILLLRMGVRPSEPVPPDGAPRICIESLFANERRLLRHQLLFTFFVLPMDWRILQQAQSVVSQMRCAPPVAPL